MMFLALGVCLLALAWYTYRGRFPLSRSPVERMLRLTISEMERRYGRDAQCPWVVLIGPSGSGKKQIMGAPTATCIAEDGHLLYSTAVGQAGVLLRVSGKVLTPGAYTKHWHALLFYLRKLRPDVPLHAVVVVMPYTELVKQNFLLYRSIKQHLSEMQVSLNVALPMYLMLSKCQEWNGFNLLTKHLSDQAVVGWCASGLSDGVAWVAECARDVVGRVDELCDSVLVFAQGASHELFSCEVSDRHAEERMAEALGVLCAPERGLVIPRMRGLYLMDAHSSGKTYFCSAVFNKKVFVEHTLAHALLPAGRLSSAARYCGAMVVLGAGLLGFVFAVKHCANLDEECARLDEKFAALADQVATLDVSLVEDKNLRSYLATEKIARVMSLMQEMYRLQFVSPWIPSSWWFFINLYRQEQCVRAIGQIKACVAAELQERADRAVARACAVAHDVFYRLRSAALVGAMVDLLKEVAEVDRAMQDLCSTSSAQITRAIRVALPGLPETCVATQAMSDPFVATLNLQKFYRTWAYLETSCYTALLRVEALAQVQDLFAAWEMFDRSPEGVRRQELEKLVVALSALIEAVEGAELQWLGGGSVDEEFKELLAMMSSAELFEQSAIRLFSQRCAGAVRRLQEAILELRGPSSFPRTIFVLSASGQIKLSSDLKRLLGGINLILAHELLQPSPRQGSSCASLGLYWSGEVWQEILREVQLQQAFRAKSEALLPAKLSAGVQASVQQAQRDRIYSFFGGMPDPGPYSGQIGWFLAISGGIKANIGYAKRVLEHLAGCDRQGCREVCEHLLLAARQFLSELREFLEHGYAYDTRALIELATSGQRDELSSKLGESRARLLYLVKNCAEAPMTLVNWIKSILPEFADSEEELYWAEVSKAVEDCGPDGAIARVEQLLVAVVAGSKDLSSLLVAQRPAGQYCGRTYDKLTWQLKIRTAAQNAARCERLHNEFLRLCKQKLAGKFPFCLPGLKPQRRVSKQDLHEVCQAFAAIAPQLQKTMEDQVVPEVMRAKYSTMLRQFERCKVLLGQDGLQVRLRVSPLDRRGGQFVRWVLYADGHSYSADWEEAVVIPWSKYEHFVFGLDIANTSPVRLLGGGRSVRLEMGGCWEWLEWINRWQSCKYHTGRVLFLHVPTTAGGVAFGVSIELLDKHGRALEWPELPIMQVD